MCPLEQLGVRAGRDGISLLPVSPKPVVRVGGTSSQPCREADISTAYRLLGDRLGLVILGPLFAV